MITIQTVSNIYFSITSSPNLLKKNELQKTIIIDKGTKKRVNGISRHLQDFIQSNDNNRNRFKHLLLCNFKPKFIEKRI